MIVCILIWMGMLCLLNDDLLDVLIILDLVSKFGCVVVLGEIGYCVKLNVNELLWLD